MKLFLMIVLEEGEGADLVEKLVDFLTSIGILRGYHLHYERVANTLLVYRG